MNVWRWGASMVERASPAGLIVAGAALAFTFPPVRKGLRSAAVLAARGLLSLAGEAEAVEGSEEFMAEAHEQKSAVKDRWQGLKSGARTHGRRAAVTAAIGALTVKDKAQELYHGASEHFQGIIEEAKASRQHPDGPESNAMEYGGADGLEAEQIDISRNKPL